MGWLLGPCVGMRHSLPPLRWLIGCPKLLMIVLNPGKVPTASIATDFRNDIFEGELILPVGKRFGHRDNLSPALNDSFLVAPELSYFHFAIGCQSCRRT